MKLITGLFALIIFAACNGDKGKDMDNKNDNKENQFSTKDAAVASVIKSLPQILNSEQKKLYNLSDEDLKSLTPGKDVPVRNLSFDDIMNSRDSSLTNMIPKENSLMVMVPLGMKNSSRLFVSLKSTKNSWQIESIGNRKFLEALRDPENMENNEVISVAGLEVDLIRRQADSARVVFIPVETNTKAGLTKGTQYSGIEMMQKLKTYAAVLSRQFGDKLKTGEIDR